MNMAPFLRNVSFHSVNMPDLLDHDLGAAARAFTEVVVLLKTSGPGGTTQPVTPITAMLFSRAEEAFQLT